MPNLALFRLRYIFSSPNSGAHSKLYFNCGAPFHLNRQLIFLGARLFGGGGPPLPRSKAKRHPKPNIATNRQKIFNLLKSCFFFLLLNFAFNSRGIFSNKAVLPLFASFTRHFRKPKLHLQIHRILPET